jgi:predicted GIY-YIG superfamily endonuclease
MFAYTYVLRCYDGDMYVGSTLNLKRRVTEHEEREKCQRLLIGGHLS